MKRLLHKKASSTLEYMTLIAFILSALFVFQHYIVRAFSGRWKDVGDSFGQGKQYDPRPYGAKGDGGGTLICAYDVDGDRWILGSCHRACAFDLDPAACRAGCPSPVDCQD
jgi:hypothetical protein